MANTERFKASSIVPVQRVGEVLAAFTSLNLTVTFSPVIEVRPDAGTLVRPKTNTPIRNLSVRKVRVKGTRIPGGGKPSETMAGKIILSVFTKRGIASREFLADEIVKAGYAASSVDSYTQGLIKEGKLLRADRGVYRIPSTVETLRDQQGRDPSST